MTSKTKTQNYTPENEAYMKATYPVDGSEAERKAAMNQIAEKLGKTVASVRSKLSHMQVYVPLAKPESNSTRITKADMLAEIADNANHPNNQFFESLAGANRDVLKWILAMQKRELIANFDEIDGDHVEAESDDSTESA